MIEWAIAERPIDGESISGDAGIVAIYPAGALIAVIDGIGHGPEAAFAAQRAGAVLHAQPPGRSVEDIFAECHAALRQTRGAAISLAALNARASAMRWARVDNVSGVLFHEQGHAKAASLITRGGAASPHRVGRRLAHDRRA